MTDPTEKSYEQLLLLRCQAGDDAAFTEIVERYSPRLHYYLRKMVGHSASVDDVLQEVWLGVLRGLPKLTDTSAFPAWIYRVARNHSAIAWRKHDQESRIVAEFETRVETEEDSDFDAEDAARVHAALDELAQEHREVLVLRFLEDMSYDDMAQATGCHIGTIRSRLHYAKRALRRALTIKSQP